MAERDPESWISWAFIAGTLAVCCALPILAIIALAAGGIATILMGAIWLSLGAMAVAVVMVGVYLARRQAARRIVVLTPEERRQ